MPTVFYDSLSISKRNQYFIYINKTAQTKYHIFILLLRFITTLRSCWYTCPSYYIKMYRTTSRITSEFINKIQLFTTSLVMWCIYENAKLVCIKITVEFYLPILGSYRTENWQAVEACSSFAVVNIRACAVMLYFSVCIYYYFI